jgi:cytochrome c-type biogenesis protein CcmE
LTRKSRRLALVVACGLGLSTAVGLSLAAFRSDIVFFMAPSQVLAHPPASDRTVRLGGVVLAGSVHLDHIDGTPVARFSVTDGQAALKVSYTGILPDLFREGQSVVALGEMGNDHMFHASEVLAKHDETYMPKDVADALRKAGKWDPRFGPPPSAASWDAMSAREIKARDVKAGNSGAEKRVAEGS